MHIVRGHSSARRRIARGLIAITTLSLVLAACGGSGTGAGGAPGQPTPTTALTGCPAPTQHVTWPSAPAAVVTTPLPTGAVALRIGQTVEVSLPFGHLWRFQSGSEQPALTLDAPAGYGDSTTGRCVWRFTAQRAGTTDLAFTMQALCPPRAICPAYVVIFKAHITVV